MTIRSVYIIYLLLLFCDHSFRISFNFNSLWNSCINVAKSWPKMQIKEVKFVF